MKISVTKKIDELGRIVLPVDYRRALGVTVDSVLSISFTDGGILIKPTASVCKLCGSEENISSELEVCRECIKRIKSA